MRPQYQPTPQYPTPQPQPQQPSGDSLSSGFRTKRRQTNLLSQPNNAVTLWDMNAPVVYVKKADASGKPSMTTYDLVERSTAPVSHTAPQTVPTVEYVTRKDFDELAAKVAALSVKPVRKVKEADNEPTV